MLSTRMEYRSAFASYEDVRNVFTECRIELEWLAYFITGDRDAAASCVVDAGGFSQSHHQVFEDGYRAGRGTLRSVWHFGPRRPGLISFRFVTLSPPVFTKNTISYRWTLLSS